MDTRATEMTITSVDQVTAPMTDHAPEPFAPVMCCDEHHEQEVRALVLARLGGSLTPRIIAGHAGVAPTDMARFILGTASLTWHARERARAKVVEES